jgi:uncharacterized protein YhfF
MRPDLAAVLERYPGARTYKFGDGPEISDLLLGLVRSGRKRATCMPVSDVESGAEHMPEVGQRDIALHWDGAPALATETTSVEVKRFIDVDAAFALAEGENASLDGWRRDHQIYFERNGGFSQEMLLICERFEVIEIF